jgi:hypothetical protein
MLLIAAAVLMLLWALGVVTSYTFGGLSHVLIILSLLAVILRIAEGPLTKSRAR